MNKQDKTKRLTLGRETIVSLDTEQLANVVGGAIVITRGNSCCLFNSCKTYA